MNKVKLFLENFLVYGFGGVISRIVPLIMIPVVTYMMPNSAYVGISDMSTTIVSFATAFAVMGMYDAMYRMFFEQDDEEYKKKICSTTFMFTMAASFVVFALMIVFRKSLARFFMESGVFAHIIIMAAFATLVGATNSILSAPTRMQNRKGIFLITNTLGPILSYGIAITLLAKKHYLIALPLAAVISALILEISFAVLNRKWFSVKCFDSKLLKQLLLIGIPLLPNFLIYWVFNSCDKVMITKFAGVATLGIYSIASKIGQCSQLIYTAFAGGWQFFAFSTMKDVNQVESNSRVFEYLGVLSYIATMFICVASRSIFVLLFPEEYLSGYIIAPYLFMAPLLQMLFQVAGNQFLVIKKTWPNMFILMTGAALNLVLNYFWIPIIGIEGAALATLAGYITSVAICVCVLYKMRLMLIRKRFYVVTLIMVLYFVLWRFFLHNALGLNCVLAVICVGFIWAFYKNETTVIVKKVLGKLTKKE